MMKNDSDLRSCPICHKSTSGVLHTELERMGDGTGLVHLVHKNCLHALNQLVRDGQDAFMNAETKRKAAIVREAADIKHQENLAVFGGLSESEQQAAFQRFIAKHREDR